MNIQEILNNELNKVDKIKYKDDRDKHCREAMKEFLLPTIKLIIKAVEEVFGDEPVQCERYVDIKHLDLFLVLYGHILLLFVFLQPLILFIITINGQLNKKDL